MAIPKHPLHAQFDEVLAEILKVKDNLYFSKINFVSSFPLPIISDISSSNSTIRDRFLDAVASLELYHETESHSQPFLKFT